MKLTLLNIKELHKKQEINFFLYWKCSLYENNHEDKCIRKYIGLSEDQSIICKIIGMGASMKANENIISRPIITLQQFETKQLEHVSMYKY